MGESLVSGRVADLKKQGLLVESGTKRNPSGVSSRRLFINTENVTGNPRDSLEINIKIHRNIDGEYWVESSLSGGVPGAKNKPSFCCYKKSVQITVPKEKEWLEGADEDVLTVVVDSSNIVA